MLRHAMIAGSLALLALATARGQNPSPAYSDPAIRDEERQHWAFVPPKQPPIPKLPATAPANWKTNPVDAFVFSTLAATKLAPAPEADRVTLIRRLTFDLHGLPPTPQEIDDFVNDAAANAYEKLVDRLLASPHYGERWAQHWLDVVRFAESNGFEADGERPNAWRYRDYVVRSLNQDKPYDRFLTEQIAGDLLAAGKPAREAAELHIATGLHRCGPIQMVSGNVERDENRQEQLTEMVTGVSSAVLGLTVACARCHDHKFDPISLGDFYRLQAFFAGAQYRNIEFATDEERAEAKKKTDAIQAQLAPIKKRLAEIEAPVRAKVLEDKKAKLPEPLRTAVMTEPAKRTPEQVKLAKDATPLLKVVWDDVVNAIPEKDRPLRAELKAKQRQLEAQLPPPLPAAWAIANDSETPATHVLRRGDVKKKWSEVQPATLRIATTAREPAKTRIDLARWLTDPGHPLTARVLVNRLWQHHFGYGIVRTPNDFGTRGDRPSHPELLDWLAVEFSTNAKWAMKPIHKLLVMSATYRQRSDIPLSKEAQAVDPDNKLLSRMNRQRLEAEAIRDSILAAAGVLNREVFGPSVKVPLEQEVYDLIFTEDEPDGLWKVTLDPKQHVRRSLYLIAKRNVRQPMLEAFDQPDTLGPCAARGVSTFAPQALILMNGPLAQENSKRMAADLLRTAGTDSEKLIAAATRRALGRLPTEAEAKTLAAFLKSQTELLAGRVKAGETIGEPSGLPIGTDPASARALADVCLALFNVNDFIYVK